MEVEDIMAAAPQRLTQRAHDLLLVSQQFHYLVWPCWPIQDGHYMAHMVHMATTTTIHIPTITAQLAETQAQQARPHQQPPHQLPMESAASLP